MRRIARAGAVTALALGVGMGPALGPASAHGGEIDVALGTDGGGGVSASLVWAGDGHPVEESAVVVVRAVSDGGEEVGPVTLVSASEGVGWYRSDAELLDEGHWTLTAQVEEPEKVEVSTEVDVVAPAEAPAATDEPDEPRSAEGDAAMADDSASSQTFPAGLPGWTGWALVALAAAGVAAVTLRWRRRR
ncbi:hypothetical protein [Isoptericola sediminis]|uniref:Uncharacterized protein n=1 Tax=Isoptericola sediminis TaxID=2733572 RepID=A0A849K065_9MICO|nr:hypothetical protein [Isoptericola sediminis]NNU26051.1 hypothetical protein [Isoptericola sediminis]